MALSQRTIDDTFLELAVQLEEVRAEEEAMAQVRHGVSMKTTRVTAVVAAAVGIAAVPLVAATSLLLAAVWLVIGVPALVLLALAVADRFGTLADEPADASPPAVSDSDRSSRS